MYNEILVPYYKITWTMITWKDPETTRPETFILQHVNPSLLRFCISKNIVSVIENKDYFWRWAKKLGYLTDEELKNISVEDFRYKTDPIHKQMVDELTRRNNPYA